MTTPLRQQHQNDSATTLDGGINNSVTSIDVTTGSVFPSTGIFRIIIGSEIMKCTARSSNTLTVVRGQDGTSAASHSDDDAVALIYSQQGVTEIFKDNEALWGYSSRKPVQGIFADDGATILTSSDFTWTNQDSATVTDRSGTILLNCPKRNAFSAHIQERTPPSAPYSYIAALRCLVLVGSSDSKPCIGIGFRETSSGKLLIIGLIEELFFQDGPQLRISQCSSPTGIFSNTRGPIEGLFVSDYVWFKITNDASNMRFAISADGIEWAEVYSQALNAFFSTGPDRVCWVGANGANNGTGSTELLVELAHWSKGE
jgi:hypothetical protein